MKFPVNHDLGETNSSDKDLNPWTPYTDDLFIMVNSYVEPATLFGWVYNRWSTSVPQIFLNKTPHVLIS